MSESEEDKITEIPLKEAFHFEENKTNQNDLFLDENYQRILIEVYIFLL